MLKPLVVANWKMNGSRSSSKQLIEEIKHHFGGYSAVDVVVAPPYVFLEQTSKILLDSQLAWGAQNVSHHEDGAFTGEISAQMLVDFSCKYVIVGHSERRTLFGEDDAIIAKKFVKAQNTGLIPILCVGEGLIDHKQKKTKEVVLHQLSKVLESAVIFKNFVIAYEPIWAIGTGLAATPEQAQEIHALIREELKQFVKEKAETIRIIYGGSVKADNAKALFEMKDINGGLIGGASLNASEFVKICNAAIS